MAAAVNLGQQLVTASKEGAIEQVGALLDQGVDVDSRVGTTGWTGLLWASRHGHRAVVVLLLDRGADVNARSDTGYSGVFGASLGGHLGIVEVLQARGANIHYVTADGRSALHRAAFYDHLPVCEFLLSKGVDLMAETSLPLGHTALGQYGQWLDPPFSPETKTLRVAALEAAWAAGPHPSQVQRRRDECWARRGPLIMVLAEHGYRPLQLRTLATALAAASLDPTSPIQPVALTTSLQRHTYLLGLVFSNEGIVRLLVMLL